MSAKVGVRMQGKQLQGVLLPSRKSPLIKGLSGMKLLDFFHFSIKSAEMFSPKLNSFGFGLIK